MAGTIFQTRSGIEKNRVGKDMETDMEKGIDYSFLVRTALFQGIQQAETGELLECLQAEQRCFSKNELIFCLGDKVETLGLVLGGSVNIETDDIWGNKNILDNIGPGQVFAETYACMPGEPLMVNAAAAEDSSVLFLNVKKLLTVCPASCPHHSRLIQNLLYVSSRKNLNLTRKMFHTAPKTIRGRLLSYLSFQAIQCGNCQYEIPFNRQQLADYLGVDRSAMSHELSKMRKDGLLIFEKNRFCLGEKFKPTV